VPSVQSERLYAALVEAGVEVELDLYEDADHMWLGSADAAEQAVERTADVLRRRFGLKRGTS
jgi:dipeptidyl aminopeptidase/acylaminoacyl peptidase